MSAVPSAQATRIVPASAADIFELLARPELHALIDGSGMVRGVQRRTPERLSRGVTFGMQMQAGPAPYTTRNEVVEFEEGRRIAWRHFGGHVWRYTLEPIDERSTEVTEQFDPRTSRSPLVLRLIRAAARNQRAIDQTLDRLVTWAEDPARTS